MLVVIMALLQEALPRLFDAKRGKRPNRAPVSAPSAPEAIGRDDHNEVIAPPPRTQPDPLTTAKRLHIEARPTPACRLCKFDQNSFWAAFNVP
jgi:hypothetical protein